jgi:hypothetical protein
VRELDPGAGTLIFHEARNPLERLEMLFAPDAKILRRNAALGSYRGGLCEYQSSAADCACGKMREMPIIRVALDRRILAHWRNDDAVGEVDVAHAKFTKKMRHGSMVSIEDGRESGSWLGAARAVVMTDALMNHIWRRSAVKPNTRGDPIVQGG